MITKDIYLAGGCFWGTEHFFKQIEGVVYTEVGFANGHTDNPTYKEVYTDETGYAETVHVQYDPKIISLKFLLQMFFKAIDPTSLNRQGHDEGTRYRTGIYYTDAKDLPVINKVFLEEQQLYEKPLVVEKQPLDRFYTAEEYHQDYLDKVPDGYCHLPLSLFEFAKTAKEKKRKTELIVFDFDGTLGDTKAIIVTTMQMTISKLGLPKRKDADCASTIGLPLTDCFKKMFPDLQKERIQQCADIYRQIFNENMLSIKPQLFPQVLETLSYLKGQGLILTIASSRSHASLKELTRDLGISSLISYMVGADDIEKAKPNPEPVLNTIAAMDIEASQTLVVGDMTVDILMGTNAGTKTCGVTWGNGTKEELIQAGADYIANSMNELIDIVNK